MEYRKLYKEEIDVLISQKCLSDEWDKIRVRKNFTTNNIINSTFSGDVYLGAFEKYVELEGGVKIKSGIYNSRIHNCKIGDNCLIENVHSYIANYIIGDNSHIRNVNSIITNGVSRFGNGTIVNVLNETGGREVPIFNNLSSHLAYIISLYRSQPSLTNKLKNMVEEYCQSIESNFGYIGEESVICNCGDIINVHIGESTSIVGASCLKNGSINSNKDSNIHIGNNVRAENFIISSDSHITDGVTISNCFIGQGCKLSHLFSAHDSLFFSNCQAENGEVCAVFAGPYTVTVHKSSLLIAGMFSFLNAGSGSNQSNHLYKLGPIHQGIVERGSKTTSNSYILWPAKIGAFSLIMGRHVNHIDSSNLPFSYLIENKDETYMAPGINLRSVGTIRDAKKWPKRDKRKDKLKLDYINFNLLSPYTIQKMIKGISILENLRLSSGENSAVYTYQSMHIKNSSLKKGIKYYSIAVNKFLGNSLIKRLEGLDIKCDEDIRERLRPESIYKGGKGNWVDISGLFAPRDAIDSLISRIINEDGISLNDINSSFEYLHNNYYNLEWTWAYYEILKWYGIDADKISIQDVINIVKLWKKCVIGLDEELYEDAKKEFSMNLQVGFGMDSCDKNNDFEQVRGDFDNNPFVQSVKEHINEKTALGDELLERCHKAMEN